MHPTAHELKAFLKGVLPVRDALVIESHLGNCDVCAQSLDEIDISGDPLVGLLRDVGGKKYVDDVSSAKKESGLDSDCGQPHQDSEFGVHDLPASFGRYEIKEQLGCGGMGVVYKAFDPTLRRFVALKIIAPHRVVRTEDRKRFRQEAESAARLQHANIVQVFEFGDQHETLYCVFELIEGGSLQGRFKESELTIKESVQIIATLSDAVEYAHERNVVHRDLKPANILLTPDGTPKIADFGLAKRLDEDSNLTIDGTLLGSPCYMAPEQARGELSAVGPATDVYALGAMLYEAIAGKPPFQADDLLATLEQVKLADPTPPSRLRHEVHRDLETVCLKCLEKRPEKRYFHAIDLAADLRRYLDGMPVSARGIGLLERFAKLGRRHPVVTSMMGLLVTALVTFIIVITSYNRRLLESNEETRQQLQDAKRKNYALQLQRARITADENPLQALRFLQDADACPIELRDFCWGYLCAFCDRELSQWEHSHEIRAIAAAPDAIHFVTGDDTGAIQIWAFGKTEPLSAMKGHDTRVNDIAFSASGHFFASASEDGTTKVWAFDTGALVLTLDPSGGRVNGVAYAPGETMLATAHSDGVVRIWKIPDGELIAELLGHEASTFRVSFDVHGKYVASGSRDETIRIWKTHKWTLHAAITNHRGFVTDVQFHPCEPNLLATASSIGVVQLWRIGSDGQVSLRQNVKGFNAAVSSIAFSHDGFYLAAGSYDGVTRLVRADSGELTTMFDRSDMQMMSIDFVPSGTLLTGSREGDIHQWKIESNPACRLIDAHRRSVTGLAYAADGRTIVSSSNDGFLRKWSTSDGHQVAEWQSDEPWITGVVGTPDYKQFTWEADGIVYLADSEPSDLSSPTQLPMAVLFPTVVCPIKGALIVVDEFGLKIVDITSGRERWSWSKESISCLAVSKDEDVIAAVGESGQLWVGSVRNNHLASVCRTTQNATCIAFSAAGDSIAVGSGNGKVIIHDALSGQEIVVIQAHVGRTECLAFSPDGKTLSSGGSDRTVKLWDAVAGLERGVLAVGDTVQTLVYGPDSKTLAAGTDDGIITLWRSD